MVNIRIKEAGYHGKFFFRPTAVLHNISFDVTEPQLITLLGANGAGKTTLINSMLGLGDWVDGEISLFGKSPTDNSRSVFGEIGAVLDLSKPKLYATVTEFLQLSAAFFGFTFNEGKSIVHRQLSKFDLSDMQHQQISKLSKGYLQRVMLARAMLNNPKLLILDEPFSGLDPAQRIVLKKLLQNLSAGGVCILLSSHEFDTVKEISERILIIRKGKLVRDCLTSEMPLGGKDFENILIKEIAG